MSTPGGTRAAVPSICSNFCARCVARTFFLVGDIVDFWSLKRRRFWPQSHNNVIRSILGKAKHDTRVVFIPGNHDEVMRDYDGMTLGNVEVHNEFIHETADGRRLLIMHGDQFDGAVVHSRLIGLIGSRIYGGLMVVNGWVNWVRRRLGRDYWSLAAFLKQRVKNAVNYIGKLRARGCPRGAGSQGRRHGLRSHSPPGNHHHQ